MKLLLVLVVVLVVVIHTITATTDHELFLRYCIREAQSKKLVDDLFFHMSERRSAWKKFMFKRSERIKFGEKIGLLNCNETLRELEREDLVVPSDEELLDQFCAEERQLGLEVASCKNGAEQKQIRRIEETSRRFREEMSVRLNRKECLGSVVEVPVRHYFDLCRRLAFYDYLLPFTYNIGIKTEQAEFINLIDKIRLQQSEDTNEIGKYCKDQLHVCCGQEVVYNTRREAPVKGAQIYLDEALKASNRCDALKKAEKFYHKEWESRKGNLMEEEYRKACELFRVKRKEMKAECGGSIFKKLG